MGRFERFAYWFARSFGSPASFMFWIVIVLAWASSGPSLHYSDTWQLIVNTPTTLVELFAAITIQYVANRLDMRSEAHTDHLIKVVEEQAAHSRAQADHILVVEKQLAALLRNTAAIAKATGCRVRSEIKVPVSESSLGKDAP